MKFKNAAVVFILAHSLGFSQYKTQSIGGIPLTLGMNREEVMKLLTPKFTLSPAGSENFIVTKYDQDKKLYKSFGVVAFDNGKLSFLNKEMDLEAWADEKQYSMAMALYDALSGSISATDSDAAKRSIANIVLSNQEVTEPEHLTIRSIDVYIGNKKTTLTISDGPSGKSTSVAVIIKTKPW